MIKTTEDISNTKKKISIEVPADAVESEVQSALNTVRSQTRLPGFRKGKAPMKLIEKRFGKDVEGEAMERLVQQYYSEALTESGLTPVSQPVVEGNIELKRNEPMAFTLTLEVRPDVDVKYEGLKVKDIPVIVGDKEVEDTLKRLQEERATYEPSEGPVKDGQIVIMDYETVEDEKSFKDEAFKIGSDLLPATFSEKLIGVIKGGTAEFPVDFPKDYYADELKGQTRTFKVTVKDIKDVTEPELDDEFAKDMNFDDLDALKKQIKERMEDSQKSSITRMQKGNLVKDLIDNHEFDPPECFIESELENMLASERAQSLAHPAPEEGAEGAPAFDENAKREEFRPEAINRAKASVVMDIIGQKETVVVNEDDIKTRIVNMAMEANTTPENMMKYYVAKDGSLEGLRQAVFEEKVLDLVLDKAELEPGDVPEEKAEEK
jgi:trigger factor